MKFIDYKFIIVLGLSIAVYFLYREIEQLNKRLHTLENKKMLELDNNEPDMLLELPPSPINQRSPAINPANIQSNGINSANPIKELKHSSDKMNVINIPVDLNDKIIPPIPIVKVKQSNFTLEEQLNDTLEEFSNEHCIYSNDMTDNNIENDKKLVDSIINMTNKYNDSDSSISNKLEVVKLSNKLDILHLSSESNSEEDDLHVSEKSNSIKSNESVSNSIKSNASVSNSIKSNASVSNSIKSNASVSNSIKSNASVSNSIKSNESVSNSIKSNESVSNSIKSNESKLIVVENNIIDTLSIDLVENNLLQKNNLNLLLKLKLTELQELATTNNIVLHIEATNKKKTKLQLAQEIFDKNI